MKLLKNVNIFASFLYICKNGYCMPNVNIDDKLYQEIKEYCKLNKLTISTFINDLLKKSFIIEKYDDAPPFFKKIKEEFTPEQFQQEYQQEPEPIKRKEYVKPEVVSVKEKELTPKEKAKQRIQYL